MLVCDISLMLTLGSVLLLSLQSELTIYHIFIYMTIAAVVEIFYNLTTTALIPHLFAEQNLAYVNAMHAWIVSISALLSSVLGALLFELVSVKVVLLCAMFSYALSLFTTLKLTLNKREMKEKKQLSRALQQRLWARAHACMAA
jgi:hypothetical protein